MMADEFGKEVRQTRRKVLANTVRALGAGLAISGVRPAAIESAASTLEAEGFSEEESRILSQAYAGAAGFVAENYGRDILDIAGKITFKKVAQEAKPGHGQYTAAVLKTEKDGTTYTELQMTEVSRESLRELYHQLGHLFFSNFIVPGQNDGVEEHEWTIRVSEGIAEAFAHLLERNGGAGLLPADMAIDVYLSDYGRKYRQDTTLSKVRFNYSPAAYQTAAAAMLLLENRFPGLFGAIARVYKQRYDAKDYSLSTEDILDKIEEVHSGFRQALEQEPALLFRQHD